MISMLRKRLRHEEKGFTLIELLVVVIILGILTAIAIPSYLSFRGRAQDSANKANVRSIIPDIESYYADNNTYSGMTMAGLQTSYDQALNLSQYTLNAVTDTATASRARRRTTRTRSRRRARGTDRAGQLLSELRLTWIDEGAGNRALSFFSRLRDHVPTTGLVKRAYAPWLAAIVGVSFAVRMVVGWLRAAPALFPDEYTYAAIGRSIAASGRPLIRGTSPHFPALLEPILTAPAWLVGDVGLGYRLVQTIGALAMSLAAVPVFLLARRLRLSGRFSLALAAFTVLVPDLVYASFVSSEAIAYPILLTAVYTAVCALSRPTRRVQIAFVVAAGLATLARVQFAVLPVLFLLATVAIGLRERRVKAALREQLLAFGLFALPLLAVVAAGPGRVLGTYRAVLGFHGGVGSVVHWAGLDAMTLAYAAGWIVVPGALLGLWLAVAKPRSRDELAFGVFSVLIALALLVQAGLLQASLPLGKEIQERYVFYAVPLIGVAFALYAARGWPLPVQHLALAAALVIVSVRLPLSQYAIPSTVDGSPILYGVYWLTGKLGEAGMAAVVVAAVVVCCQSSPYSGRGARGSAPRSRSGSRCSPPARRPPEPSPSTSRTPRSRRRRSCRATRHGSTGPASTGQRSSRPGAGVAPRRCRSSSGTARSSRSCSSLAPASSTASARSA